MLVRSTRLDEKQPNPGSKSRTEVNPGNSKNTARADFFFPTPTAEWRKKFVFHLYKQFKKHITRNLRAGGR
jgi:hypothetical protein